MNKVISSNITRSFNKPNDELYELLKVVPAKPISYIPDKSNTCEFQPRNDKQYVPKKKNRQKVSTVRDIRAVFEKDVLNELPIELEKQQNFLLRKIKGGSLREEKTKSVAKKMLLCDKPLTKSSWQMLMNINPEGHAHSMQYVLWNGKPIRINGSKGGKNKFICKYDLRRIKNTSKKGFSFKNNATYRKKGLLQNSLSVDFKPGPLACKKFLDNSYQKYHVGDIDVVNLPKPGLEIQPLHGTALEPTISSFVNKLRDENGAITQKWAEYAVSVLGTVSGSNINQVNQGKSVTFDLRYKHDQTKLLMRKDLEGEHDVSEDKIVVGSKIVDRKVKDDPDILPEVQIMIKGILDAVEINVNQDKMYKEDDEVREDCQPSNPQNTIKEKFKKRYCELDRLDVTVIRLDENESDMGGHNTCNNSYCTLGCICSSLQSTVVLKRHCGRIDCMFECKCDFSKYAIGDSLESDCPELLPGLLNLNNEIKCTLSKEEKKFHQTVILSGDKSIVLKSKKRSCKSSKRYEDYYNNISLKTKSKVQPILTIIEPKLNCENIVPWCMVHNLYKCFCKGRFTETKLHDLSINDTNKKSTEIINVPDDSIETRVDEGKRRENDDFCQINYHNRTRKDKNNVQYSQEIYEIDSDDDDTDLCARIKPYEGRKYNDNYYLSANNKIQEMEINDSKLRKRLHTLMNNGSDACENNIIRTEDVSHPEKVDDTLARDEPQSSNSVSLLSDSDSNCEPIKPKITMVDESSTEKNISNKPKLVAWLESSYQEYKRRLDMGIIKNTLEPPRKGKVVLYQWDFILSRYSERKNLFLVSKQSPYRIFMAVNAKNPQFDNCINIDDIRFADLHKYPTTVKNLLTSTNNLKDYFCILYGYNHCWEFIGTVTKMNDQKDSDLDDEAPDKTEDNQKAMSTKSSKLLVDMDAEASLTISTAIQQMSPIPETNPKQSKWFILTVENDFSEIQFYNKGFFVKYYSIIKAINVARMSGKTVRLSSQKCAENTMADETQFGIYAIPNANEYCVFIGPYELNEPLGVETIKDITDVVKRKRTRGVWITTDKVDNSKVIDNPLSFIPPERTEYNDIVSIETGSKENNDTSTTKDISNAEKIKQITENKPVKETLKLVKPIKISKSNGFYRLGKNTLLKTVSVLKSPNKQEVATIKPKQLVNSSVNANVNTTPIIEDTSTDIATPILSETGSQPIPSSLPMTCSDVKVKKIQNRPVAEVAPQIKISAVYSEFNPEAPVPKKRREGGMFILKPEEINQRLVIDGNKSPKAGPSKSVHDDQEITMDIEHFLDTSRICPAPEHEAYVISDDEEIPPNDPVDVKYIYMECTNIEDLGAIRGEMHSTKGLRFDFPGFNVSDYYQGDEVFNKINQVLSRRVYIPRDLKLEWRIVNSFSELKTPRLLKKESFGANLIMTPQGIKEKNTLKFKDYSNVKTYTKKNKKTTKSTRPSWSSESNNDITMGDHMVESSKKLDKNPD